eukprot:scaffold6818_cov103-Isochrysis_galbana.AAC.1
MRVAPCRSGWCHQPRTLGLCCRGGRSPTAVITAAHTAAHAAVHSTIHSAMRRAMHIALRVHSRTASLPSQARCGGAGKSRDDERLRPCRRRCRRHTRRRPGR